MTPTEQLSFGVWIVTCMAGGGFLGQVRPWIGWALVLVGGLPLAVGGWQ